MQPHRQQPTRLPVPGVLQARTLEWVAISFSNAWKWKLKVKSLSCVRLSAAPSTTAYQVAPSVGFSRLEYCSGLPLPSLEYIPRETLIVGHWHCRGAESRPSIHQHIFTRITAADALKEHLGTEMMKASRSQHPELAPPLSVSQVSQKGFQLGESIHCGCRREQLKCLLTSHLSQTSLLPLKNSNQAPVEDRTPL